MQSDLRAGATPPVVLITGAAGALGVAVAHHFGLEGAALALLDRLAAPVPACLADRALVQTVDLLDRDDVERAINAVSERWGRVDVAVNLAGGFAMGEPVHGTLDATWQHLFDLNVRTMLRSAGAVVPLMQRQQRGVIVNVGAASAQRGMPQMGAYAASKSALARLTESMSSELKRDGIRVNAVLPSVLDTRSNRLAMPDADPADWVAPEDLAAVIAFLASDGARAIHGACVPVTGLM